MKTILGVIVDQIVITGERPRFDMLWQEISTISRPSCFFIDVVIVIFDQIVITGERPRFDILRQEMSTFSCLILLFVLARASVISSQKARLIL